MANPFVDISQEKLDKLAFPHDKRWYVYHSDSNGNMLGWMYETDHESYTKIERLLQGNPSVSVSKGDKIFVISGNSMPLFRIKEYAKRIGATITRDISKATVILGNDDVSARSEHTKYTNQITLSKSLFIDEAMYFTYDDNTHTFPDLVEALDIWDIPKSERYNVCFSKTVKNKLGFMDNMDVNNDDRYFIFPTTMELIYAVLSKGLKIMSQETLFENAHSNVKLTDKTMFENIDKMLNSNDSSDWDLAVEMLINCDVKNAEYELWKLANEHGYTISRRNNSKNLKLFLANTNWNQISNYTRYGFVRNLHESGAMTPIIMEKVFKELFEEACEDFEGMDAIRFFNFKLTINDEYAQYMPSQEEIEEPKTEEDEVDQL